MLETSTLQLVLSTRGQMEVFSSHGFEIIFSRIYKRRLWPNKLRRNVYDWKTDPVLGKRLGNAYRVPRKFVSSVKHFVSLSFFTTTSTWNFVKRIGGREM